MEKEIARKDTKTKKSKILFKLFLSMIRKRSFSFHSYPTHPIDAHITRAGIARRAVHHTVRKHDREELTFWFAVQLTRSTYTHTVQKVQKEKERLKKKKIDPGSAQIK